MTATATEATEPQISPADLDAPMDVDQAAEYLKVEPETLHLWRRNREKKKKHASWGPECSKLGSDGRTTRYTMRDLMAFMAERKLPSKQAK